MNFLLSDKDAGRACTRSSLNLPTRTDSSPTTSTSRPSRSSRTWPRRSPVGRTPYTLTFFEQINDPAGPVAADAPAGVLHRRRLDTVIADAKTAMKEISCQARLDAIERRRPAAVPPDAAPRPRRHVRRSDVYATTSLQADRAALRGAGAPLRARLHRRTRSRTWCGMSFDQLVAASPRRSSSDSTTSTRPSTTTSSGCRSGYTLEVHRAASPRS